MIDKKHLGKKLTQGCLRMKLCQPNKEQSLLVCVVDLSHRLVIGNCRSPSQLILVGHIPDMKPVVVRKHKWCLTVSVNQVVYFCLLSVLEVNLNQYDNAVSFGCEPAQGKSVGLCPTFK